MKNLFDKYPKTKDFDFLPEEIKKIQKKSIDYNSLEILNKIFSLIDLTSLNTDDNELKIISICNKLNSFKKEFPEISEVAGFCIYPPFIKTVKDNLQTNVRVVSVAGGFPSGQTLNKIKKFEARMVAEMGVDEIDIVFPVGKFFEKKYKEVFMDIHEIKSEISDKKLKVILETGLFKNLSEIRLASLISMEAGADFIKTSTGKLQPAATPEAVIVMTKTIKEFYNKTEKQIGIKPAGGITTFKDALIYYTIVRKNLGEEWIKPELFRIGASKLVNNLLMEINNKKNKDSQSITFF